MPLDIQHLRIHLYDHALVEHFNKKHNACQMGLDCPSQSPKTGWRLAG